MTQNKNIFLAEKGYLEEIDGLGVFYVSDGKRHKIDDLDLLADSLQKFKEQKKIKYKTIGDVIKIKKNDEEDKDKLSFSDFYQTIEKPIGQKEAVIGFDFESQVGDRPSHRMHTTGQFNNQDGWVYANTRTRTWTWFGGYRGGVSFALVDRDGRIIFTSDPREHAFGVDGCAIGRCDRT